MSKYFHESMNFKKRTTWAVGRNGESIQKGIDVEGRDDIHIRPINSYDYTTRCVITIPREDIPEFIELLKQI